MYSIVMINFKYKVKNIKFNGTEQPKFHLIRPHGTNDYILLLFKTTGIIVIDGEEQTYSPNDLVILKPYTPHEIDNRENILIHDWMHFTAFPEESFANSSLIFNKLMHCPVASKISDFIKLVFNESISSSIDEDMINMLLNVAFEYIARGYNFGLNISKHELGLKNEFDKIRNQIYFEHVFPDTLSDMAAACFLGESRFSHLYKKFYNVSPMQDVLSAKIQFAKQILLTTNYSIKTISKICSFENEYVFIRYFKKKVGMPPNKWRQN